MQKKAHIFDNDGTLVMGSQECFDEALFQTGQDKKIDGLTRDWIAKTTPGKSAEVTLPLLGVTGERLMECVAYYRHIAQLLLPTRTRWIPGVPEMLEDLRTKGDKIAVLTTTAKGNVDAILKSVNLTNFMQREWILDGTDLPKEKRKPKPDGIYILADRMGKMDVQNTTMTGDHDTDVLAGRAANCRAAILVQGVHTKDGEGEDAHFVAKNIRALHDYLLSI
jgi:phosphoglycolate phosphatase-like HAD superfamily hydrolase